VPTVADHLDALQARARLLEEERFPPVTKLMQVAAMTEELGELARCSLKSDQTHDGYRDSAWEDLAFEEAGDLGLVLAAHCEEWGFSLWDAIRASEQKLRAKPTAAQREADRG